MKNKKLKKMKKLLPVLLMLVSQINFAQSVELSTKRKDYIAADIVMESGDTISGFIKDFTVPRTIEFEGFDFGFGTIESSINIDRAKFTFKKQIDGEVEKLELKNIKLIIFDEETTKFEKLKLKTVNSQLEIVDVKNEVLVPIIEEGIINLYGLKVYQCSSGKNCELFWIIVYLKKPNDEFAYIPIDLNKLTFFNMGSTDEKMFKIMEEIGKDCPTFLEYLANYKLKFDDKKYQKELKENYKIDYKNFQAEKAEKLKNIKDSDERKAMSDDLYVQFYLKNYYRLIDEYSSRCN